MVAELEAPVHSESTAALVRAIAIGAGVGAVTGGVIGTLSFPLVGTFFGALVGTVVGALFGLANGLVLAGVVELTVSRWIPAIACALTTLSCSAAFVVARHGVWPGSHEPANLLVVATCTLLAALLGPIAAYGARPLELGRRLGRRPVSTVVKTALAVGAVGGGASGAVIGAGIGIATHPATAPFAVIEGGILCAVSGAVAALLIAAFLIAPRLRVRR